MLRIAIIIGSTRPGRKGEAVAKWAYEIAKKRSDAEFELVDIKDFNLPLLDEPMPRSQAKEYGVTVWQYIRLTSDPVVRAIVLEDSAALIGLCLAASGLLLSTILGTNVPDSLASLLIGLLLAITAFGLARPLADFLVGRSLPAPLLEKLYTILKEDAAIDEVLSLRATYSGPEEVIAVAKVRPSPNLNIEQLARVMDDLDRRIRHALPIVADVFVDVTAYRAENDPRD